MYLVSVLHRDPRAGKKLQGVSTLKQCQAKLEQARARAEAADRSKSQFLTNVNHEIRTLNGIMGFNHRPKLTKRQKEYSKLIQASSKSLLSLFDDVLDRGNIETGMMEIEALPFKLDARDNSPASVSPAGCALENDGCTYTVLVAEDHQINVTVILAVLDAAGCETELAANGQQALAKLDKADFDLIIMDSQMPVMNGLEATKKSGAAPTGKAVSRSCLSPRMPPKVQKRGSYQRAPTPI